MIVVDEWHELIGNKRGVQVQLALRAIGRSSHANGGRPAPMTWGLVARTLGNLAAATAGPAAGKAMRRTGARAGRTRQMRHRHAAARRPRAFSVGRPPRHRRCSRRWSRDRIVVETTLVFTNMRSQAEIWYQLLLEAQPAWAGLIALHHGSLDRESARLGRAGD